MRWMFFHNWTAGEGYALIVRNVLHYFVNPLRSGIWRPGLLAALVILTGCGQIRVERPTEAQLASEAAKPTCVLPFQNPSSHTIDRTLDFLACFSAQPDLLRVHQILSRWRDRLGKEQMDVFLSPIEALVTDPPFFRYVLSIMKDPDFPRRIAPFVQAFETYVRSPLGSWGIALLQNTLREFSGEIQNFLQRDLRDPRERALWMSSAYLMGVSAAVALETYQPPTDDQRILWEKIKRPFWSRLLGEVKNPAVRDWVQRKHRTFIDYFWTQGPEYRVLDLLLGNYPNSLIQSFSENVWLLKQAGRSGDIEQQHFTDYVDVHMNVMFNSIWPIDEIKLILSRSSPITFQLFQVNTPDYAEVDYSRWLNRNLLVLESAGALYQFVQLVQILFDLDRDVFWRVMGWMCAEPGSEGCSVFQGVSYLWAQSSAMHVARQVPMVPEFVKQKAVVIERDEDFKQRAVEVFPEIPDSEAWLDALLDLVDRMEPVLLDWANDLAEGRQQVPSQKKLALQDQTFLTQADQFVAHLAAMPQVSELIEVWQVILDQPELVNLLTSSSSFLVSSSASDILSRTAVLGERFLSEIPPWEVENQTPFALQDRPTVVRKPLVDWYEMVPPTPAQEWEIALVRDSIEHPSPTVSPEWSQMAGINTLYYMFMPDYLVREDFDALHALKWIASLSEVFDYPNTLSVIPPVKLDGVIPASVEFGPEFVGPYSDDPLKRVLWRLQLTRAQSSSGPGQNPQETLAEVLIRRFQEQLIRVPNLDVLLMRLASERSFMLLHPDREVKAMREMIALVESRLDCAGKDQANPFCRIPKDLRSYLDRWEREKNTMQPYGLKIERADWGESSIFEEMENIMALSQHSFFIDLDKTRTIDSFIPGIPGSLPKPELSQEGQRLSIIMRVLGVDGLYYDDMSMHFFVNLVHNSDGHWPRIHELVNRVFFDEFTGAGKLTLDNYVDSKAQFKSAVFEGIAFPSGRVYCAEYHMCDFPTEVSLLMTLAQFSTFRYMAEPLGNGESFFSVFFPFFQDVDGFTAPEHRLSHAWGQNHLGFFMDLGRVHGMRAVRPFILHLAETGELAHALQLVKEYLSSYQTHDDFTYLNMTVGLLGEKLPLFKRLLDQLPNLEGINPVYVFDLVWVGMMAALERMEKVTPPRAPDIDQWVAAVLSVLDEKMVDDVAAFARVVEPPLRSLLGSARFLRLVGNQHEVLKILTKIFFNVAVTDPLKIPRTFAQRQQLIRDNIAQLSQWTDLAKEQISKQSWEALVHPDPLSDAQWIQNRADRLAMYLQGLFFPRGKQQP